MTRKSESKEMSRMERRRILKAIGAGSAIPSLSMTGSASSSPPADKGPRRTNGNENAPAAIITGGRGNPIPERAVRNKRQALINRVGVERGALEQNIIAEDEDLLAYGIRVEEGAPMEYLNTIPKSAEPSAYKRAADIAHDRARKFKRAEL